MKKLVIAATTIVMSVALNAVSVDWSSTKGALYNGDDTKLTSGDAYLVFVTSSYTQSTLVKDFYASSGKTEATLSALTKANVLATGTGIVSDLNSRPSGSSTYNISADASAYFIVFNNNKLYVSDVTDFVALLQF